MNFVHLPNSKEAFLNPDTLHLVTIYESLLDFIGSLIAIFPGGSTDRVLAYLAFRRTHEPSIKQDLLPLLVYMVVSQHPPDKVMPLAAGWTLYLAACHLLDDAQDNQNIHQANGTVAALGVANIALVQLQTDQDTLCDILDAFGRVTALATNAQAKEYAPGRIRSRTEYFQTIGSKAATIISTGAWAGGRLATDDVQTLTILKEFGLAWGMGMQVADDCLDLEEDLAHGLYTLPVIEGLAKTDHPDYLLLKQLLCETSLQKHEIRTIVNILEEMGTVDACRRLARAYQMQAAAVFNFLPGLRPYFSDYVAPES